MSGHNRCQMNLQGILEGLPDAPGTLESVLVWLEVAVLDAV
jgi:hypothetical protein